MKQIHWLVVLVAVGLLAVALYWRSGPSRAAVSNATSPTATTDKAAELETPQERQAPRTLDAAVQDSPESAGTDEEPTDPPAERDEGAILKGRFLLPDGSPAQGVAIEVHGWGANQERKLEYGLPEDWRDLKETTNAEGRFELRFDPPQAFQFTLDAKLIGYAKASWRWGRLRPTQTMDLGDVTLTETGAIVGRVVDSDGGVPAGLWMIYGDSSLEQQGAGGDRTRVMAPANPTTGAFRLEGLPPGPVQLKAHSQIANWVDGPTVRVRAREEAEAEIVYEGPDNSSRIVVVTFSRPFYTFDPESGTILLHTGAGEPLVAEKIQGSSRWSFDDLAPGQYTVEIVDPKFRPWSRSGVQPGQRIDARLAGSGAVALALRDAESREKVTDYGLRLRYQNSRTPFELRASDAAEPTGGVYVGLIPGDFTLVVLSAKHGSVEIPIDGLEPGEQRTVDALLSRGATVRGLVVRADGSPVPDTPVVLAPYVERAGEDSFADAMREQEARREVEDRVRETEADDAGAFELQNVAPGRYDLTATVGPLVQAEALGVEVPPGELSGLRLVLPATGRLIGRLLGPAGASFDGAVLVASEPTRNQRDDFFPRHAYTAVAADGSFDLHPLPVGKLAIDLAFPDRDTHRFDVSFHSGPRFRLGLVEIDAGGPTSRDFDVRDRVPGTLRVTVRVNGESAPGMRVHARSDDDALGWPSGLVGPNGEVVLAPVFPATWTVVVQGYGASYYNAGEWTYFGPAPIEVTPGAEVEAVVDVPLYEGMLTVLDPQSSDPVVGVTVILDAESGGSVRRVTDDEGRILGTLPPGTYGVRRWVRGARRPEAVEIEWTAAGPVPNTLQLAVPASPDGED